MSVDENTYLGIFPTGYTDSADTLRSEFIADFNAVDKKRIPDTLNAIYRLITKFKHFKHPPSCSICNDNDNENKMV